MLRLVVISLLLLTVTVSMADSNSLSKARKAELENLLLQDCGSCHGLLRKGGLGPSLELERMLIYPDEALGAIISSGIQGTAMPSWGELLSQDDINYLVYLLKQPIKQ